jgi:hypothetical protein
VDAGTVEAVNNEPEAQARAIMLLATPMTSMPAWSGRLESRPTGLSIEKTKKPGVRDAGP